MKNPIRTEGVIYTELKEMEKQLDFQTDAFTHNVDGAWYRMVKVRNTVDKLRNELAEISAGV